MKDERRVIVVYPSPFQSGNYWIGEFSCGHGFTGVHSSELAREMVCEVCKDFLKRNEAPIGAEGRNAE